MKSIHQTFDSKNYIFNALECTFFWQMLSNSFQLLVILSNAEMVLYWGLTELTLTEACIMDIDFEIFHSHSLSIVTSVVSYISLDHPLLLLPTF